MSAGDVKRALDAYGQTSLDTMVDTASPHRLIVMLFEGAIKAIHLARLHLQNGDIPQKGRAISKAIAIVEEGLRLSLDKEKGGELAQNLDALYDYMSVELLQANLQNDNERLERVLTLLGQLKEAWESIEPNSTVVAAEVPAPAASGRDTLSYGRI